MEFSGFDWDRGNRTKCQKHGVSLVAIESLFHGEVAILPDAAHSLRERRYRAIGWTAEGRAVFVVFTFVVGVGPSWYARSAPATCMQGK